MGDHTLFFYGTLMAPPILHRVIHGTTKPEPWQIEMLTIRPAILDGHTRHRVRHADYPAVIPAAAHTGNGFGSGRSTSVRGTLVSGLTDMDIVRLDHFEGSAYAKKEIKVRVFKGKAAARDDGDADKEKVSSAKAEAEGEEVMASTYIWIAGEDHLEDEEWDFETFKRDKLAQWAGADEDEWELF